MARKPRQNHAGGIYHVFARGNNREPIYREDRDRELYLDQLEKVVRRHEWLALSFCLMDNHVHLLLETPQANLSDGMRTLHGEYAQLFNRRHERVGHVFQGRYGAVMMRSDGQVCVAAAYIASNPVVAGLCAAVGDWRWSSFGAVTAGTTPAWIDDERLLSFFDSRSNVARRRYAEMSAARADALPAAA